MIGTEIYDYHAGGVYVLNEGGLVYQTPDTPDYLWYMETDSMDISVRRENGKE